MQIGDTDIVNADRQLFTDDEIDAFLALNTSIVKLAAADALQAMASNQLMVLKVLKNMDLSTDGAKMSDAWLDQAKELRKSWLEVGDGSFEGAFDWAEFADTDFAKRERILKEYERTGE